MEFAVVRFLFNPRRSHPLLFVVLLACALQCFWPGFLPFLFAFMPGEITITVNGRPMPEYGVLLLAWASYLAARIHSLFQPAKP